MSSASSGRMSCCFAVQLVADADLDLGQAVEHVELGDAQARDAVDDHRALEQRRVEPAAAARPPGHRAALLADRRQVMADRSRLVDRQLGRERPAADARGVGLGDAEDVVQLVGADARAGGRVAGDAVARGDERIGAVVDVEQGALRAFEQDVPAGLVELVERVADVADHRPHLFAGAHRHLEDRLELERARPAAGRPARSYAAPEGRAVSRRSARGA